MTSPRAAGSGRTATRSSSSWWWRVGAHNGLLAGADGTKIPPTGREATTTAVLSNTVRDSDVLVLAARESVARFLANEMRDREAGESLNLVW